MMFSIILVICCWGPPCLTTKELLKTNLGKRSLEKKFGLCGSLLQKKATRVKPHVS